MNKTGRLGEPRRGESRIDATVRGFTTAIEDVIGAAREKTKGMRQWLPSAPSRKALGGPETALEQRAERSIRSLPVIDAAQATYAVSTFPVASPSYHAVEPTSFNVAAEDATLFLRLGNDDAELVDDELRRRAAFTASVYRPYYQLGVQMNELFQFESQMESLLEIHDGRFSETAFSRCRLYAAADNLYWALRSLLPHARSPLRGGRVPTNTRNGGFCAAECCSDSRGSSSDLRSL